MIYAKLLEIAKKKIIINKDATNPFHKSKYATLDNIIEKYTDILIENWLVVYHETVCEWDKTYLKTTIIDSTDNTMSKVSTMIPLNEDTTMQKLWSSITYAKRYNLGCLLNIVTDEDTDMWSGKQEDKQEDDKPRFNDDNFKKFKEWLLNWTIKAETFDEAYKLIQQKYKVSKKMKEQVLEAYKK